MLDDDEQTKVLEVVCIGLAVFILLMFVLIGIACLTLIFIRVY